MSAHSRAVPEEYIAGDAPFGPNAHRSAKSLVCILHTHMGDLRIPLINMALNSEPDEIITYQAHLHWVILFRPFATGLVGLTILAIGIRYNRELIRWAAFVFIAIALLQVIHAVIGYFAWKYQVTNRRVRIQTGVLNIRSIDLLLTKVESIEIVMPFLANMMGYGTVVVIGTGGTREPFTLIDSPELFRQAVYEQIEKLHK